MKLAAALRQRPLAIVAGSRLSSSRSVAELTRQLHDERLAYGDHTCRSWLQGARLRRHLGDELGESILELLSRHESAPPSTLAGLPLDLVLTTSVGDDWERAFAAADKVVHSVCPGESPDYDFDAVVYHLFGKASEPDTLVLSERDLLRNLDETDVGALVQGWSSSRVFVFIGFSLDDDELQRVLERLLPHDSRSEHFAFVDAASPVERAELQASFGVQVLGESSAAVDVLVSQVRGTSRLMTSEPADLDAIMARAAEDAADPAVAAGLERLEYRLRQDRSYERLVDLYVARLSLAEQPDDRQRILLETASLLEREMGDLDRAFHATVSAYRELADACLLPELARRAQAPGHKRILADALLDSRAHIDRSHRGDLLVLAATSLQEIGDSEAALEALEQDTADVYAAPRLTRLYLALLEDGERWWELAVVLQRAAERSDFLEDKEAYLVECSRLLEHRLREPWGALEVHRKLLELNPHHALALDAVERLLVELHQIPALLDFLRDHQDHFSTTELHNKLWRLGERCLKTGDSVNALRCFERLREEDPQNEGVLARLRELYSEHGESSKLVEVLESKIGASRSNVERAKLCRELAAIQEERGDVDAAAECWEWVWNDQGGSREATEALERLYRRAGRWQSLLALYSRELEAPATEDGARFLLAMADVHERELHDPGPAIDLLFQARDLGETSTAIDRRLLSLLETARRHPEAARLADEVGADADTDADRAQWFEAAARLWQRHGDTSRALDSVNAALTAAPEHAELSALLARLQLEAGATELAAEAYDRAARFSTGADSTRYALKSARLFEDIDASDRAVAVLEQRWLGGNEARILAHELRRLYEVSGRHAELIRFLDVQLERATGDDEIDGLLALADAHAALRHGKEELDCLERALSAAPERKDIARRLADTACSRERWVLAAAACQRLLAADAAIEDQVAGHCIMASVRVAQGKRDEALEHLGEARERLPFDRKVLALSADLAVDRPDEQIGYLRALLLDAAHDERADLLVRIGDLCAAKLGERAEARDAYLAALQLRPDDHLLLHRCLDMSIEDEEWDESLEYLERLTETEKDPKVRARYRSTTAQLCDEKLGDLDTAMALLWTAVDESPADHALLRQLASGLERRRDWQGLLDCTSRLLAALRDDPSVSAEVHAAAWFDLAQLCRTQLGDRDTALCALEVAVNLQPRRVAYRLELAECYEDDGRHGDAIGQHQAILELEPTLVSSYNALARLYATSGDDEATNACRRAVSALCGIDFEDAEPTPASTDKLSPERLQGLRHPGDDLVLGRLLALMTPALAVLRPGRRRRATTQSRRRQLDAKHPVVRVIEALAERLGVCPPEVYLDSETATPVRASVENREESLVPIVIVNGDAMVNSDSAAMRFQLARTLVLLRRSYLAQTLQTPVELGHSLDAMVQVASSSSASDDSKTARALRGVLTPLTFDQMKDLVLRLDLGDSTGRARIEAWLQASALTASRIALWVVGDLDAALEALPSIHDDDDAREADRQNLVRAFCAPAMRATMTAIPRAPVTRSPVASLHQRSAEGKAHAMRRRFRDAAINVTQELSLDSL